MNDTLDRLRAADPALMMTEPDPRDSRAQALLEQVLARGRRDRTIRPAATPIDIIITGAMLAQPLPHAADWDQLARRQARIFIAGLSATDPPLAGSRATRARR